MAANPNDDIDALRAITQVLEPFGSEDQSRILRWVSEKLSLSVSPASALTPIPPAAPGAPAGRGQADVTRSHSKDIRSFIAAKKPKNDTQLAAVVAYYHRFEATETKEAITKEDLIEACRLAVQTRPPAPGQTLRNAVNAGLLDKAERGSFAINSVGENLVAVTLPGDGSASEAAPRRRSKSAAKKKDANNTPSPRASTHKTAAKKSAPKKK